MATTIPAGRFAPSPTGRMHLGNLFTALISWLSIKKQHGKWILRIEDLDPQRSRMEYARQLEDDLQWLGLYWDEGGLDGKGPHGPYRQSMRTDIYERYLSILKNTGLTYPCTCTRADIMSTQAPHQSDGRVIYRGTCRPAAFPNLYRGYSSTPHAIRLYVPDEQMVFSDIVYGQQEVNLAGSCGDFVLRRSDGAWAYQLAVVIDDATMGVSEVVRGNDLLLSAAQQLYLYRLLGLTPPNFAHLPLICNAAMQRLSKRDVCMSMEHLRKHYSPQELTGYLAVLAGINDVMEPCAPKDLIDRFEWHFIKPVQGIRNGLC